ncbi:unnamed protein product [Prorocentrum cordatum]|uniref:Uncharacterized protein n=1 Tax=Prorocentrum cordatum TaxID=2364126 RepID=A0ABN9T061_9DINO|nr:unnamed protein product [Polarella glacialis]
MLPLVLGGAVDATIAYLHRCPAAPECPSCSLTCPACPSFTCPPPATVSCPACPALVCPAVAAEAPRSCPACAACEQPAEPEPCDAWRAFLRGLLGGAVGGVLLTLLFVKYVGTTPDGDTYIEKYDDNDNEDVDLVRWSAGWNDVPNGVNPAGVYRFRQEPTAAEKHVFLRDAERLADHRCRIVAATIGRPDLLTAPGFRALVPGAAAGPAAAAGPRPGVLQGVAPQAAAADAGTRWRAAQSLGDVRYGDEVPGHVATAAAVRGRDLHILADGTALFVEEVPAAELEVFMGRAVAADARVMPVMRTGARREVTRTSGATGWLVTGPRTTFWCIEFINNEGMGIDGHHDRFRAVAKLEPTQWGVQEHFQRTQYIRLLLLSDQCDGTNLQACEAIFRRMQTIEYSYLEKVREREGANQSGKLSIEEQTHFAGSTRISSSLMVCPDLLEFVRKVVEREAALAKNLRKAREEKEALKKGKKATGGRLRMVNSSALPLVVMSPRVWLLAILFLCQYRQSHLYVLTVVDFCREVAVSGFSSVTLVISTFGVDTSEALRRLRAPGFYGPDEDVKLGNYNPDLLSLPSVGSHAVPLADLRGAGGCRRVAEFVRDSVLPAGPALERRKMCGVRAPYSDPALRQPRVWSDFVSRLRRSGLLDFAYDRGRESVEFFCVPKKDQRLRLVCDCRHSNVWFREPDNVTLCTGETLGNLEVGEGETLYISEADLSNAFYHLQLPVELRDLFTLRRVRARDIGLTEIGGQPVRDGYVDNFVAISTVTSKVHRLASAVVEGFREAGLVVTADVDSPGEVLERLAGHMGFISLVRRESLSVFDTLFAFIRRFYYEEAPLWPSVINELTIWEGIAPLLWRNLKASWGPSLYAVDASPTGLGAAAAAAVSDDPEVQWLSGVHDNGSGGLWDVDGGPPPAGSAAAVLGSGLGDSRDTVFREVPLKLLRRDWKIVGRYKWNVEEPMPILEGRAILYALRHALRNVQNFGRRIAVLGDALVAACAVSKGRSDSRAMLKVTQSVAALCLATGCVLHCRWLPSEWNVADGPSRGLAVPSVPQPLSFSKPHELEWLRSAGQPAPAPRPRPAAGGDAATSVAVDRLPADWVGFAALGEEQFDADASRFEPVFIGGVSFAGRSQQRASGCAPPGARVKEAARRRAAATAAEGLTVCQTHSVRPATLRLCQDDFASFKRWLSRQGRPMPEGKLDTDQTLSQYLDEMYLDGAHVSLGQRMLAAALFHQSALSKAGGARMARSRRALKGWQRLAPAGSRLGAPCEVMCMIVMWLRGLFTISSTQAGQAFDRAVQALGLQRAGVVCRYQLRHGGASHDAATGARCAYPHSAAHESRTGMGSQRPGYKGELGTGSCCGGRLAAPVAAAVASERQLANRLQCKRWEAPAPPPPPPAAAEPLWLQRVASEDLIVEIVILLLPPGVHPVVSILTPDRDQYKESLAAGGDIAEFAILEGGALGKHAHGIGVDHVQWFQHLPLPAQLQGMRDDAAQRLGLPLRPGLAINMLGRSGFAGMAAGPPAPQAADGGLPGAGVAGLAAALGGPGPAAAAPAAPVAAAAAPAAAGVGPGGALVPAAALPAAAAAPPPAAAPALGADAGLVLAGPLGAGAAPAAAAPAGLAAAAPAAPAPAGGLSDVRVHPVALDVQGNRRRMFRDAIMLMREDAWPDWPIRGPRTVMWVLRFIEQNGGTPMGRHMRFRTEAKLSASDVGVDEHERACRMLEQMVMYDQLMVTNLACAESLCRVIQVQEGRYRGHLAGGAEGSNDNHLYMGTDTVRGCVCVSPQLAEFVKTQLTQEYQISKERRKAREERALAKKGAKKGGLKESGPGDVSVILRDLFLVVVLTGFQEPGPRGGLRALRPSQRRGRLGGVLGMPAATAKRKAARARAITETRAAAAQRMVSERQPAGSLAAPGQLAIRPSTEVLYKKVAMAFLTFCMARRLGWASTSEMDQAIAACMNQCFIEDSSSDQGSQLLASLAHFYPSLRGSWKSRWPRATRASIAWKRRVPAGARLPMPKAVASAARLLLAEAGQPLMALWVAITFVAYLRPGGAFKLKGKNIVPPPPAAGAPHRHWGLLLHDAASFVAGKTGVHDESALIDLDPWLEPGLAYLRSSTTAEASLWPFTAAALRHKYSMCLALLGPPQETKLLAELSTIHADVFRLGHLMMDHFWAACLAGGTEASGVGHLVPTTCKAAILGARFCASCEDGVFSAIVSSSAAQLGWIAYLGSLNRMAALEHARKSQGSRLDRVEAEIRDLRAAMDLDRASPPAPKVVDQSFNRPVDPSIIIIRCKLQTAMARVEASLDQWLAAGIVNGSDCQLKGDPTGTKFTLQVLGAPSYAARKVQQRLGNMRMENGGFRRFEPQSVTNENGPIFVGPGKNSVMVKKEIAPKTMVQILRHHHSSKRFYKDADAGEVSCNWRPLLKVTPISATSPPPPIQRSPANLTAESICRNAIEGSIAAAACGNAQPTQRCS